MNEIVGLYPAMGAGGRGGASTLTALLSAAARRFPDKVAVQHEGAALTYAELIQQAECVAKSLRARGVGPDVRVGLCAERSLDLLVGLVGILKAGGAYVPLDPTYPAERLAFIVEDAGIQVVVATAGGASVLDACCSGKLEVLRLGELDRASKAVGEARATTRAPRPGDAAYVIYTSGSTGVPKGVVVTHRNVCRLLKQTEPWFHFGPTDVWTLFHSFAFDFSVWEIWGALAYGGRLVVAPYETTRSPEEFYRLLVTQGVTVLNQTPSAFRRLAAAAQALPELKADALKVVIFGGEALDFRTLTPWLTRYDLGQPRLVNMYGITETTVHVTYHEVREEDLVSGRSLIGQPIPDLTLRLLDAEGQPALQGEPGELYVGGEGVARGYLNRPELTAERFIADPFSVDPCARLYRTGDLARRLCDDNLEYLGRIDQQVKIRGFRIELGEIEAVLAEHPAIREAVVDAQDAGEDEKRLVAYLVAAAGATAPSTTELRRHLGARLPDYMLPSAVVWLDVLPLTSNGKIDRRALPAPTRERPALEQPFAAPRGEFERFVADAWSRLIGIDRVGRHDRFFELGGTSLLAMRFLEVCRSERDFKLSVAEFFDAPTVEHIARIAAQREAAAATPLAPTAQRSTDDRIAIIGVAGRFAGAPDVASFWDMILAGRSGRVEVTAADLQAAGEDPALLQDPDYVAAAFPLDQAEDFDAAFFGFTPREVELMDPQQRIMLEAAWTALEDAGVDPKRGAARVGVFGGVGRNAYLLNNLMSHPALRASAADYHMLIGNERDFPATHIAYRLGLQGPAMTVQTACSTSGVAIHMAAESLRRGECDLALAGGAKVLSPNRVGYRYEDGGPLSPDGLIRAFDAEANGMVRGSGVAMVALKRLDEALAAGDHIYGVLIGSAVNNDGDNKAGFTAPSVSGQAAVIAEAYQKAGVSAETVSMIEAHGTGTVLGDPIEVEGLTRAFRTTSAAEAYCALGSVKTNIGHLDAGATAAGLIKAVLSLQNEVIPPSLNFKEPNPRIGFCGSPFYVAAEPVAWKRGESPRRAGISSFGLGGTNAHLLIEEAPARPASAPAQGAQLLVLSARTETALARRCADLADWLEHNPGANLADVAHTLRVGRRRFEKRAAIICADPAEAVAKLRRMAPGETLRGTHAGEAPPVTFLFPGGGAQYAGMARDLYAAQPAFRAALDACNRIYEARTGGSLVARILDADTPLEQPSVALPALFAVEYAMAQTWLAWGVEPAAMIGHSMGEYAAACLAGVFSLEDALELVLCRGRLFDTLQPGSMLSVPLPAADLSDRLTADLSIAAINRDDQCVVSGPTDAVQALADTLAKDGVETRRVHINVAAHSTLVEPILGEFGDQLRRITLNAPTRPFLSNLTGDWITEAEATDPDYWVRHLRGTVRFADGMARLLEEPERTFLEIGPGQVLSTLTRQNARRGAGHDVIATLRHPQETKSDTDFLLEAAAKFWLAGGTFDEAAFAGAGRRRTPLPTYPFERTRHWIDAVPFAANDQAAATPAAVAAPARIEAPAAATLVEAEPAARRERILAQLKAIICRLSGLPIERVDAHATFLELGFDSLFLTQANAAFKKAFKVKLSTRQLIETTPVLDALATYLDETLPADAAIGQAEAPAVAKASGAAPVRAEDSPGRAVIRKTAATELTADQEAYIDGLIATTTRRTPQAKAQTQAARFVLADPRTVQGFRSRWKEMVYPVLSDRAQGARIWDVDGNEYIDLVGGYGVNLFGHQPSFVVEALRAQIDRTLAIGPQTVLAGEVATLVSDMTGMERVAFCNTGSEAVLAAVRMARTVTGKSKIAKFDGHYHGIFDEMQVRGSGPGSRKTTVPSSPGIPAEAIQNTLILEYGNADAFDVLRENADDIALVLVEPVRSRNPDFQPREYLHELRRVTEELGIPLLFDEMITGFRSHPGGAQAIFGVRADIATYGKVAGGGLPIGIVAGSAQFMDTLDGGMWAFGDDSSPQSDMTWFAGTFVRHPLALAATKATLEHLKREGPALQEGLNARTAKLADELNAYLKRARTPIKVERFASLLRVTFTEHQEYADLLFFELRNRGILTYEGRPIFLTTAHTDADLAAVRDAFIASVGALTRVGLLDGRDPDAVRKIPLAVGQQEIWVSAQFSPEASCSYNLCSTLNLTGAFSLELFRAALDDLTDRHEALRTTPDRDGQTQSIRPTITAPLSFEDARADSADARATRIARAERHEVTTPFDLANGPLVRSKVIRLKDDEHLVMLTVHHVIADGWSCGVLMRDLGELYAARQAGRPAALEPAQQLSDFIEFLGQAEQRESQAEARDYWVNLYGKTFKPIEFPSDRQRPKTRDYSAQRLSIQMEPAVAAALRRAALDNGTTLFASLIGGFAAYLTRLTGVADNSIGFSAAGQPLLGGKDLVGHCVNFLPLRLSANLQQGFGAHLRGIGASILDALEHQTFDFLSFVQEIQPRRDANWAPLVSIGVNLDPSAKGVSFADLQAEAGSVGRAYENLDLFVNFVEVDADVELQCTFNTSLFDEATVRRRMQEYLRLLAAGAADPEAPLETLELIGDDDRRRMLTDWNGETQLYPRDAGLAELFSAVARKHAGRTALIVAKSPTEAVPSRRVSYGDLDAMSDQWAARLRQAGVARGAFVALLLPRSLDLIVGILATLKAGAAYVPVTPTMPAAAIARILGHSEASTVLTVQAFPDVAIPDGVTVLQMDGAQPDVPADGVRGPQAGGEDPAYVLYTSGSTGEPKGVVVPQRGVSRLVLETDFTPLDATRTLLLLAPISFDISMFEIWGALLNGGTLVVPPWEQLSEIARLGDILKATGVTTLQMTPALFNTIIDESPQILNGVDELMVGGEAMSVSHTHRALKLLPKTTLINVYGPTENAVWSTFYRVPRDFDGQSPSVPIGRPIRNSQAYVVDERMRLVPPGVPGELVVGGDGVAIGYLKQPELTAAQFVADTIAGQPGARLYRTGDVCRLLPDGALEFHGRRDTQVKIRGFRIELGEVEAALQEIAGVSQAVAAHEPGADGGRLVAFVIPADDSVTPDQLTRGLREQLPKHLVPSQIVLVPELPLSAHGKVDRRALLAMIPDVAETVRDVAPQTQTEEMLAAIWADILQRRVTSVEESFFNLGGHSLMAVRLFDRIWRRFNIDLPISTLFTHPSIRDLAELIDRTDASPGTAAEIDPSADWDTTTVIHPGPAASLERPIFLVSGLGGNVNNLVELGAILGRRRKVVGLQTRGIMGHDPRETVEEMAAEHLRYIRAHQPKGPYLLGGYSAGAQIAFEMARQLAAQGEAVDQLVLLDTYAPNIPTLANHFDPASVPINLTLRERVPLELENLRHRGIGQIGARVSSKVRSVLRTWRLDRLVTETPLLARSHRAAVAWLEAARNYQGGSYDGSVSLVMTKANTPREQKFVAEYPFLGWDTLIDPARIARKTMDGSHFEMVKGEEAEALAVFIEAGIASSSAKP